MIWTVECLHDGCEFSVDGETQEELGPQIEAHFEEVHPDESRVISWSNNEPPVGEGDAR